MKEASDPQSQSHGDTHRSLRRPAISPISPTSAPVSGQQSLASAASATPNNGGNTASSPRHNTKGGRRDGGGGPSSSSSGTGAVNTSQAAQPGSLVAGTTEEKQNVVEQEKKSVAQRFWKNFKAVLFNSKVNVLLVFVPIGIAVAQIHSLPPGVIFAMNAIAIVPLAGLLSYATESVAHRLGDSLGALLNVTFGNAVELIIFIALVKDQIRIVQASLLGSILANLLLILGMSFFLGGLRFREQIYNSTVTQMSACLLSLSVISLVLPTAFHASFSDDKLADEQSLKVSRGTSVILLLVYIVYLLFQLISHSYLYESTPQHIIDEEATPGPAANWLDSSSSDSSSSSDTDSSDSDHSRNTVSRRMRRVMRRRRSSVVSTETGEVSNPSPRTLSGDNPLEGSSANPDATGQKSSAGASEEGDDEKGHRHGKRHRHRLPKRKHRKHNKRRSNTAESDAVGETIVENNEAEVASPDTRRVDFAPEVMNHEESLAANGEPRTRSPFQGLRSMSFRPVVSSLAPSVFTQPPDVNNTPAAPAGPVPRVRYGIRRTNSLPDRLSQYYRPPGAMMPSQIPLAHPPMLTATEEPHSEQMSRTAAVILLLVSTALVAVCAEFMVDSINGLVETSHINEIFIGLIILPIVGNAAEHVTAITVAMKNKMDLAIGVAVGSSIQIALFITPLVVIIGWGMDRNMTLYFTLFETVCLFVSAFMTNFLVLDGRSNYLEGALLMSTYVIIGVVAFFYPDPRDASTWGA
ncbi:Sodium/calcium exchanger protein-domain-containing protein [Dichotomopilus funicola]|uniref:Sodium/calcium exchanger protein-domain-containing protein n=1 Tax=Dichotomopilus funicola TaxID=1934379 RepID=A0AAN6V4U2_9PEZI|nr:Sodium/calcium exchanger protein-domain-containing protein [Dichotomopilus funicola]